MSRDYMDIGSAPANEDCAQVGAEDYHEKARPECTRFINLIRQTLGEEPEGARLAIKSNPHDFGSYFSVVCHYDDDNEAATKYAFRCEAEAPREWSDGDDSLKNLRPAKVCDSCLSAAADEGPDDLETQTLLMQEMGGDVADHLCDARESAGDVPACLCACFRPWRP